MRHEMSVKWQIYRWSYVIFVEQHLSNVETLSSQPTASIVMVVHLLYDDCSRVGVQRSQNGQ